MVSEFSLTGKNLGSYQILEEIGRGGMAVVYKAWQPSLERHIAVKVLPPQFTFDARFVRRFEQEAVSAARLQHPNIVTIHDVGQQDGVHYIAMA
jgi:serine/threonine protein kinase